MIKLDIRPFQKGDADAMLTMESLFCGTEIDRRPVRPAYTARHNGTLLACAGVKCFWPGVGEAWAFISPEIVAYKRELLFYMRKYIQHIADTEKLWRIQAVVRKDFPQGLRLTRHLGFTMEGKLAQYGPDGTDCFMFSRIFE